MNSTSFDCPQCIEPLDHSKAYVCVQRSCVLFLPINLVSFHRRFSVINFYWTSLSVQFDSEHPKGQEDWSVLHHETKDSRKRRIHTCGGIRFEEKTWGFVIVTRLILLKVYFVTDQMRLSLVSGWLSETRGFVSDAAGVSSTFSPRRIVLGCFMGAVPLNEVWRRTNTGSFYFDRLI